MNAETELLFSDREGFKLDPGHSPECYLAEQGRQEFIVYDGWENRDRIGRKRASGGMWWHRFTCNCTKCDARLLVRWDVLMEFFAPGSSK